MTARISLILEKARGHRTCEKIEVAEHLPSPSGRGQGEGLRIWIDFRLRAIALAVRATFIPDPQREFFIGNEFSPRTMRTPQLLAVFPATLTRNPPFLTSFPEK
jgi:hypothetical protein